MFIGTFSLECFVEFNTCITLIDMCTVHQILQGVLLQDVLESWVQNVGAWSMSEGQRNFFHKTSYTNAKSQRHNFPPHMLSKLHPFAQNC